MDEESRRFFQAVMTCLALSAGLGVAVLGLLAWML